MTSRKYVSVLQIIQASQQGCYSILELPDLLYQARGKNNLMNEIENDTYIHVTPIFASVAQLNTLFYNYWHYRIRKKFCGVFNFVFFVDDKDP